MKISNNDNKKCKSDINKIKMKNIKAIAVRRKNLQKLFQTLCCSPRYG